MKRKESADNHGRYLLRYAGSIVLATRVEVFVPSNFPCEIRGVLFSITNPVFFFSFLHKESFPFFGTPLCDPDMCTFLRASDSTLA